MIENQWYAIYPSKQVAKGSSVAIRRMNLNLILFRTEQNVLGCLQDQCTHRGAALSKGTVKNNCIACPFHGIEFAIDGTCKFIPALGKASHDDLSRFKVKDYHIREDYGIIYMWYGEGEPTETLPFFPEDIDESDVYSEIEDHWTAFYSRCIENQLDVIHLPFVHYNTIGRGDKTVVNGPSMSFEDDVLQLSSQNAVDTGQIPTHDTNIPFGKTYLKFKFPNVWMNHVSDKIRIMIYFAPIDDENTILYIRFYSKIAKHRTLNRIIAFLGKYANRIIERQDKRVVITQEPKMSHYKSNEKLLSGDLPIVVYRRHRDELKSVNQDQT